MMFSMTFKVQLEYKNGAAVLLVSLPSSIAVLLGTHAPLFS